MLDLSIVPTQQAVNEFRDQLNSCVVESLEAIESGATLEIALTPTGLAIFTTDGKDKITNCIPIGGKACLGVAQVLFKRGREIVVESERPGFEKALDSAKGKSDEVINS